MEKNLSIYDKTQICSSQLLPNIEIEKSSFLIEDQENIKKEFQNEKQKKLMKSMQQFCKEFCRDFYTKTHVQFTINQIASKYSIKNRRVYDLIGILQGFSIIQKLKKKGTYIWNSIDQNKCSYNFQQNKSIALKDIAGLLKLLLKNNRYGLTIKQLNQKILLKILQKTKRQQCSKTINRRIYQCLKIMKIFGMVQKQGNFFRLIGCHKKKLEAILAKEAEQKDGNLFNNESKLLRKQKLNANKNF